jgi:hypothetical protein
MCVSENRCSETCNFKIIEIKYKDTISDPKSAFKNYVKNEMKTQIDEFEKSNEMKLSEPIVDIYYDDNQKLGVIVSKNEDQKLYDKLYNTLANERYQKQLREAEKQRIANAEKERKLREEEKRRAQNTAISMLW